MVAWVAERMQVRHLERDRRQDHFALVPVESPLSYQTQTAKTSGLRPGRSSRRCPRLRGAPLRARASKAVTPLADRSAPLRLRAPPHSSGIASRSELSGWAGTLSG